MNGVNSNVPVMTYFVNLNNTNIQRYQDWSVEIQRITFTQYIRESQLTIVYFEITSIADDPQHCHPIPYYRYLTVPPPIRSKRSSAERSVSKEPSIPKSIGNELDQLSEEPVIQKSEIYLEIDSNSTVVEA